MKYAKTVLRSLLPLALRKYLRDKAESVRRAIPGAPRGLPHLGLAPTQIYPVGTNFDPVLLAATQEKLAGITITERTRIASIGTCFAEEFSFYMLAKRFNYIRTEPDAFSSSANWGRVYTIPNLQQIVRYSFDQKFELCVEHSAKGWLDPLRESSTGTFATREEAISSIKSHRQASQRAFSEAEVLIMTVGQNEAWIDQRNKMVWGRMPSKEVLDSAPGAFSVREFSFQENHTLLTGLIEDLLKNNPVLQIVLTVSPVPSYATFCDVDVVSQSLANKCLLRTVVHDVIPRFPGQVFYFPSFEMVLGYNPRNFRADNRHVKYATVDRIFALLERAMVNRAP